MEYLLRIDGNPIPWAAHRGYGRRAYNPRYADKLRAQVQLRRQWQLSPIEKAVSIVFQFFFPVPGSYSQKKRKEMLSKYEVHVKKPDCTNLQKHAEDFLKGIVIKDDNQVVHIQSSKCWIDAQDGYTNITIREIQ